MSTLQVTNIQDTAGGNNLTSAQLYSGAAKAWVNYNGVTPGIRASFNVSSVTKNSTGSYTVNFTTAMVDGNYTISGFADVNAAKLGFYGSSNGANLSTGSVLVCSSTSGASTALSDAFQMHVAVFR